MLPSFATQTITRIRPGTKKERGQTVPNWDYAPASTAAAQDVTYATELDIPGCSVQPAGTGLSQDGRILGVQDGLTVYAPAEADIQGGDRIRFGGNVYTINGDPRVWPAAARCEHIQLNLQRWRG